MGAGDSQLLAGMLAEMTVDKESLMTMVAGKERPEGIRGFADGC